MQKNNVIKPSESPCVLVRKRDGTLRFCVDCRALNSVTKPDVLPLPRINDLLKLGKSRYYTMLDLKSGCWQIKVHADSQEKLLLLPIGDYLNSIWSYKCSSYVSAFDAIRLQSKCDTEIICIY